MGSVERIPSDDADVFRLMFTSRRQARILKMATHGIRAVWREIDAFRAMRRLGIGEVLAFEHASQDLPDLGIDFHITCELAHPQQARRTLADLWVSDRAARGSQAAAALEVLLRFAATDLPPLVERSWPTGSRQA